MEDESLVVLGERGDEIDMIGMGVLSVGQREAEVVAVYFVACCVGFAV